MTASPQAAEFTITRTYNAPIDMVWRAWTEEAELAEWLKPFGVSTDSISFDVRVGGKYTYTMTEESTGKTFPTGGTYLEVEPTRRLVFTWGLPDDPVAQAPVITITFEPQSDGDGDGDGTTMVFHLSGYPGRPGDGNVHDGWDEALTNLGRHLAGEPLG